MPGETRARDAEARLSAQILRPDGPLAAICGALLASRSPADPDALLADGAALALRLVFAHIAAARGLIPAGLAPGSDDTMRRLRALGHAAARGEVAPGAFTPGGLLDDATLPRLWADPGEDDSLAPALSDLSALVRGGAGVRLLGALYERVAGLRARLDGGRVRLVPGGTSRDAGGVYFTPAPILDEIVRETVERTLRERRAPIEGRLRALAAAGRSEAAAEARAFVEREVLSLRVCDPAMGSGHILVRAAHALAALAAETLALAGAPPDSGLLGEAGRCLYGADVRPLAADLARLSLWLECSAPGRPLRGLGGRLLAGESLVGIDWPAALPEVFARGGFDAVVGNPPWGADLGGLRDALRGRYRAGAAESSGLFVELALRLCRSGGRVGLVTPNTWLTLVRAGGLRRLVLEAGDLELAAEVGQGAFADAPSIAPLVFVLRRGPPGATTRVRAAGGSGETLADQSHWRSDPGGTIDLRLSPAARRALDRIATRSTPLGEVALVAYGIKTGANAANLAPEPRDETYVPALTDGSEVRRYAIAWSGRYLRYGPHLDGYRRSDVAVPKIVVQYIRNLALPRRIVAALDETGVYYPLNNFSYIAATAAYDLGYLTALLCSRLLNAVFAARFHDYNIKPAYLRHLPVRRVAFTTAPEERAALARRLAGRLDEPGDALGMVDELLAAAPERADVVHDALALIARRLGALCARGTPDAMPEINRLDRLCDRIVARLYGLGDGEWGCDEGV